MRVDKDHGQTISELRRGVHVQIALQQAANLEGGLVVEFVCSPASLQPTPTLCYPRVSVISEHVTNWVQRVTISDDPDEALAFA
jgi:hypothetical protein